MAFTWMRTTRTKGRVLLVAVALTVGLGTGTAVTTGTVQAAAVPPGTIFNKPTSTVTAEQQAIRTQFRTLLAQADPGSTVRLAIYHLWDGTISSELAAAHTARGVNVQVVMDDSSYTDPVADTSSYNTLKAGLGTDTTKASYVKRCAAALACLGDGINHNKFALFSSVGGGTAKSVVLQMTSNLTPSNYSKYWNSSVTVAGNTELYAAYSAYFAKLPKQDRAGWDYTYASAGAYKVYFFPRAGTDSATDTAVNTSTTSSASGPTPPDRTAA